MNEIDINKIADLVKAKTLFCTKEVLTSDEVARYMGISKSYLYKLTMRNEIPHYKPMGKKSVVNWLYYSKLLPLIKICHD